MLFNSYEFLFAFLPVVLVGWWSIRPPPARLAFLTASSYFFYAWWDWRFLPLMLASTTVDYIAGRALVALDDDEPRRRVVLVAALTANLAMLGYFKYAGFFVDSLDGIGSTLGLGAPFPELGIVLPIGISFYTFNSMSYTIDIFRREVQPARQPPALRRVRLDVPAPHRRADRALLDHRRPAAQADAAAHVGARRLGHVLPELRPCEEAPDRRHARAARRPALRAPRPPRSGRRLDGGRGVRAPALLRLLRLLRHGGRARVPARVPVPPELQLAVQVA